VIYMGKNKATNEECYFFDLDYPNNCRACSETNCRCCHFFVIKTDKRQIKLDKDFQKQCELMYYHNGVRK